MNRAQRRAAKKGRRPGESYNDKLARERFIKESARKAVDDTAVQVQVDMRTQTNIWLMCVAMNRAFHIGPKRFQRFLEAYQEVDDWFASMVKEGDHEYAIEKLRQEASRISGQEIRYIYEAEMRAAEMREAEQ